MSSSFPEFSKRNMFSRVALAFTGIAVPTGAALGADSYVQPILELRAVSSSNLDLDPVTNSESDTYGAIANLSALFGIATPQSTTSILPRLRLQEYADREAVEPVEGSLDFRSTYRAERSEFELFAKYSYRDSYTAELADAEFDPLDPGDPTTPETGINTIGETRQRFDFRPEFTRDVSERTRIGAGLQYQGVRYSSEAALNRVDYDYGRAGAFIGWAIAPRRSFAIGGYASKYEAKNFLNESDAYGATLAFSQQWSETAETRFEVGYESNDIVSDAIPLGESTSNFGANLTSTWEGEVSEWRLTAGRTFTPTGRGGKSITDQLRIQYDRQLSERLWLRGAARYLSDESLSDAGSGGNRDYGRLEFSLQWYMTPTWFIGGGYHYTYQDREIDPEAADDNRFFLSVNYRGLGRERR